MEATGEADLETQRLLFGDTALAKGAQPTPTPDPNADLGDINDVVMVEDGAAHPTAWAPTNTAAISCNAATRARRSSRCRPA